VFFYRVTEKSPGKRSTNGDDHYIKFDTHEKKKKKKKPQIFLFVYC